jgi:allantoicase
MSETTSPIAAFQGLTDLASERLGGRALATNDEFFAEKENLLKAEAAIFIPDKYTPRGKWMDGWESRRRRSPGHDWVIIRLGLPGVLHGVDIDTAHFLGNHPPYASLDALDWLGPKDNLDNVDENAWREVLPRSPLQPGSHNLFAIQSGDCYSHLRLKIFPDGGVARLRAYGEVHKDWSQLTMGSTQDLASVAQGGKAVACSDMFFSSMENLILPGTSRNMGDGWETRRRRGPGHDWVIVRLGLEGELKRIDVDTSWFKGNFPESVSFDACRPSSAIDQLTWDQEEWTEIVPRQKLSGDTLHSFKEEINHPGPWSYVRMNIHPDGGVARLRVWGKIAGLALP